MQQDFGASGYVPGGPPVGGPLPHIADHVVNAVAVWRKRRHRRGAIEAILTFIFVRKISLPGIGAMPAAGGKLVAPGKLGAVEATARGEFPLSLGRQILARPFSVGERRPCKRRARRDNCLDPGCYSSGRKGAANSRPSEMPTTHPSLSDRPDVAAV